ncbi:MAG: hypothetical protein WC047_04080 [Kiritimatiellales bacterium]
MKQENDYRNPGRREAPETADGGVKWSVGKGAGRLKYRLTHRSFQALEKPARNFSKVWKHWGAS